MSKVKHHTIKFSKLDKSALVTEQELLTQIEYVQAKRTLHQFASFLPDEILRFHGSANQMRLSHHFVGILLCIDVSGIIELIDRHFTGATSELYILCVNLNAYLGAIIEVLRFYGGDVIEIICNNCVTMWKCPPDGAINEIIHTAIVCADVLQNLLGAYNTDVQITLKLKTVITCGNVSYGIYGNHYVKRPVFTGDAFKSMRSLMAAACFNAVVLGVNSYPHLTKERYTVGDEIDGYVIVKKISYSSREVDLKSYFDEKYLKIGRLVKVHYEQRDAMKNQLLSSRLLTNIKMHTQFIKKLPPREEISKTVRYWSVEEMRPLQNEVVFEHLCDSQPGDFLTEMRDTTCLYLKIFAKIESAVKLLDVVENIFTIVVNECRTLQCVVQHIYVTDAAIMIRIIFGLLVGNRENEAALALQLARKLKRLLELKKDVLEVSAGVSVGNVFCSAIGHPLRREYSIIGRPIIQARRLAIMSGNKVLCDLKVFNNAKLSAFYFKLFQEEDEDAIIEFDEGFDTKEVVEGLFPLIDRTADFNLVVAMIQNPETVGFSGISLHSSEKLGKTMLLTHLNEKAQQHNCTVAFVTLLDMFKRPYYCISEIYRQIYDRAYLITPDIQHFLDLPRDLIDFVSRADNTDEDIAIQKYRTLNRFRDLVAYTTKTIVIFIDDFHFIDVQSWEIIELTFPAPQLRLVIACSPSILPMALMRRLQYIREIRVKELLPLKDRFIAPLACSMMQAQAVSHHLIHLLTATCRGNPGNVECMLLRMVNNGSVDVHFSARDYIDTTTHYYENINETRKIETIFTIIDILPDKIIAQKMSMDTMYTDVFNSLPAFLQLILKSASVIGSQFGRQLLRLTMYLPDESDLALGIKVLFEEKVFQCASMVIQQKQFNPSVICCGCHFEAQFYNEPHPHPKYAYCKLMQFRNEYLKDVAYKRLAENHRHELHVLCGEVLEKMDHICPSCMRNPANYYAFFGHYHQFLEFCQDPSIPQNYYEYAKNSYENMKPVIYEHVIANKVVNLPKDEAKPLIKFSRVLDLKYIPVRRHFNYAQCHCIEMLHVIYRDLIRHANQANENGKMIFYKLKFGLIQICMRDIAGGIKTLHETRELTLVNCGLKHDTLSPMFRKYHVGKASVGLAICNLKMKDVATAKGNIMLALRQYNVPLVAFTFKHFRFLLRRRHIPFRRSRSYSVTKDAFGWELGNALFICAKVFSLENNLSIAHDCCRCGIYLLREQNKNIGVLLDTYCEAIRIYSLYGDNHSCERLQKYLVREFQETYAQNDTFYFHMLFDMLYIVIELTIAKGNLEESISLGYRFCHLSDHSKVLQMNPAVLLLLCELNLFNLSFRHFVDMMAMLKRYLSTSHHYNSLYYYLMSMYCYVYTGFHVVNFEEVEAFARAYFQNSTRPITRSERAFKLLIHIYLLRCNRVERAGEWEVRMDFKGSVRSSCKFMRLMILQMEGYLLNLVRSIRMNEGIDEDQWKNKIKILFQLIKEAVEHNLMYKPAYLGLRAWYLMLKNRRREAMKKVKKMYTLAEEHKIDYFMALAMRLKNHWEGGYLLEYGTRPHVNVREAPSYSFRQIAQFLHSYIIP